MKWVIVAKLLAQLAALIEGLSELVGKLGDHPAVASASQLLSKAQAALETAGSLGESSSEATPGPHESRLTIDG
jgi:hypothetical protein